MPVVRWALIVGLTLVLLFMVTSACSLTPGGPGTIDFIQYWSAWQLMRRGDNPYDANLLGQMQSALTGTSDFLIFSWNPPWTFLALSPILSLPFGQSASMWLALQVVLVVIVSMTTPRALCGHVPRPLMCALATIFFFPILQSMKMGQLGILFATSISLFLYFQGIGAFLLAGLSLLPLSFKPHLFFLFVVPGVLWLKQLPSQARARFLLGSLGGFCLLVLTCCAAWPSGFTYWLQALTTKEVTGVGAQAVHITDWQTATMVTWIRLMLQHQSGVLVTWPMLTIPLVSFLACSLYIYRRCQPIRWESLTPPLLCLSLGTCNYGWVFDQSVLVVCQIALVGALYALSNRTRVLICVVILLAIQALSIVGANTLELAQHYYAWIPWAYLVLLWVFTSSPSERVCVPSISGARSDETLRVP